LVSLLWKPRVLIEIKKRGEDINKHYIKDFIYWQRLVPNRPRYVILCNFDEFWIFDFDRQLDEPVDKIPLNQLIERIGAFAFMEYGGVRTPVFRNNQVEITENAAKRMGELFTILKARLYRKECRGERPFALTNNTFFIPNSEIIAQRFILQCVLAMFAEDRGLLPRDVFISSVQDCLQNQQSSYDLIGGLFREMNQPGITPAGRYQGVDYFNGGLFSTIYPIDLTEQELKILDVVAREDWSKIRPAIFGNIFESSVNQKDRHSYGIHYTSESDIMKIVRPTISDYWEEKIESATTIKELNQLQLELQNYRVLDPACGSGNFLYVAYQELNRIELLLINKISAKKRTKQEQLIMSFVTPHQFYGMDVNPFAVELARVTLMIARKVAIDKFNLSEPSLPLDSLDHNIVCQDALFNDWIKADAIIGNPPFLGGARIRTELGDNYAEKLFNKFSDVRDKVDFCSYWFRLAHENIKENGRVGLVATNTISQGLARKASLDYIVTNNGYIHEAIASQKWSGEAAVYVSIVNWCYEKPDEYYLDHQLVKQINSSLTTSVDVTQVTMIKTNSNYCFKGVQPTGKGFIITEKQAQLWIDQDAKNQQVLKQFLDAKDLASNPHGKPSRWIIDFNDMSLEDASDYQLLFEYIKINVKPERDKNRRESTKLNWWKFAEKRPGMRKAIKNLDYYLGIPRVSKWFIFLPIASKYLPGDSTVIVASENFYILGILTSKVHRLWINAQSSTLGETIRYTHNTCFETFPFPQTANKNTREKIREIMMKLHEYRTEQMEKKQIGITELYNKFFHESSSQLYKLHQQLDQLVMEIYGFKKDDDILKKLLELNLELAEKESKGEKIIGCE
jgi:SAM-dependent methyltransferase